MPWLMGGIVKVEFFAPTKNVIISFLRKLIEIYRSVYGKNFGYGYYS